MFSRVLVANRGEIAVRVIRALHELGIEAVAIYSTADADALHVRLADHAVCIGPPSATDSYLRIPNVIAAANTTGLNAGQYRLRVNVPIAGQLLWDGVLELTDAPGTAVPLSVYCSYQDMARGHFVGWIAQKLVKELSSSDVTVQSSHNCRPAAVVERFIDAARQINRYSQTGQWLVSTSS